jgi:hypothetical protein
MGYYGVESTISNNHIPFAGIQEVRAMSSNYELIKFPTADGGFIYAEVTPTEIDNIQSASTDGEPGIVQAGKKHKKQQKEPLASQETIESVLQQIAVIANGVSESTKMMTQKPAEFEVAFHATLSAEFGIKLVTLSSEATMEIKLVWKEKE